jgi:hypothetical protein
MELRRRRQPWFARAFKGEVVGAGTAAVPELQILGFDGAVLPRKTGVKKGGRVGGGGRRSWGVVEGG